MGGGDDGLHWVRERISCLNNGNTLKFAALRVAHDYDFDVWSLEILPGL
jgi:hypothetical protein